MRTFFDKAEPETLYFLGSRESAPTNNRKFTSDKRQQAQCAGARSRARAQRALSPQPLYNLHSWVGSILTR